MTYVLLSVLTISICLNILLFTQRKKPQKTESLELRSFLHDLTSGDALVQVRRVAPSDVFIKVGRN